MGGKNKIFITDGEFTIEYRKGSMDSNILIYTYTADDFKILQQLIYAKDI
jgi:hypothetical protein